MPSHGKKRTQKKQKKDIRIMLLAVTVLAVAIVAAAIFSFRQNNFLNTTSSPPQNYNYNCGELQVDINSMKEAASYYRYGIQKPAGANFKFEIIDMKVTNNANIFEDLSGFRMKLVASDGSSYAPTQFNSIEKITLADNSVIDYSCSELALASVSRFGLNALQSTGGCKIFLMLSNLLPASLQIYDTSGLKCTISLG